MILHLCEDEKFIDHVIDVFEEAAPNYNIYFIETIAGQTKLNYVTTNHKNIVIGNTESTQFKNITNKLELFDVVILHNLYNPYKQKVVENATKNVRFHWMSWGADIYNYIPKLTNRLYLDNYKTKKKKKKNVNGLIGDFICSIVPNIWYKLYLQPKGLKNPNYYKFLVQKICSVSTVMPSEYHLIQKHLNRKIKYKPFKYLSLEQVHLTEQTPICQNNNFLIGNSAHRSGNQLDAIEKVHQVTSTENIIIPLSYGDSKYREIILRKGHKLLGERFKPILNFLPIQDYNNLLLECGNVVMNHNRQQGLGNIIIGLWNGARVFLNQRNPIYRDLKRQGIILYSLSDLKNYNDLLSFNQLAEHNRPIIKKLYSRENVIKEAKELVHSFVK